MKSSKLFGIPYLRWLLLLPITASLAQPVPPGTKVAFEVVKLDPNPVMTGSPFSILVNIQNLSSRKVTLQVSQSTQQSPFNQQFALGPQQAQLFEMLGQFSTPGVFSVKVSLDIWSTVSLTASHGQPKSGWLPIGASELPITIYSPQHPPAHPVLWDLSPNSVSQPHVDFSGVVQTIAGSSKELYAIPKTGGVWRSINGSQWLPEPQSPPRAFSIAIDPSNSRHIAIGERADDDAGVSSITGHSGLWESPNEGDGWIYTYNPVPLASSQRVNAVTFSQTTSTLIAATTSGIVRRAESSKIAPLQGAFTNPTLSRGCTDIATFGAITAVTASKTRFWARSATHVFYSDDDGLTWECEPLRSPVDIGSDKNMVADYNTADNGGNDNDAIGAFDDRAFLVFKQFVPSTDPRAPADPRCDPKSSKFIPGFNDCEINNKSALMTFFPGNADPNRWVPQYTGDGDGRGFNGRRFANAYEFDARTCPGQLTDRSIGKGRQLIYGSAQGIQQAIGLGTGGTLVFDKVLNLRGFGSSTSKLIDVHSDMWQFHYPTDYCPPANRAVYLATDGGISQGLAKGNDLRLSSMKWQTVSQGLHVQTAQDIFVAESPSPPMPGSGGAPLSILNIAYPTQDNDGWWRAQNGKWTNVAAGGDANYVIGDVALPLAVIWRRLENFPDADAGQLAAIIGSDGQVIHFTLNMNQPFDGPTRITAIQSLSSENQPDPSLDVAMLVRLPLSDKNGKPVPDPAGATGSGSRFAVIRNTAFNKNPDGPATKFAAWHVEADSLPTDARRFWVSGGHSATKYYLYTGAGNADCADGLQTLVRTLIGAEPRPHLTKTWKCLLTGLQDVPSGNDFVPMHGPVFVDPFDSNVLLVATGTSVSPSSLKLSINGGTDFCDLPVLTALVTESGRYRIVGVYNPGDRFSEVGSTFHGYPLSVPSDVGFNRHDPSEIIVSSPFTGLFWGRLTPPMQPVSGSCVDQDWKEPTWRNLGPALPHEKAYITSTVLVNGGAVLSTEGRGVYGISNLSIANVASFFNVPSSVFAGQPIAHLLASDGTPIPWGRVLQAVVPVNVSTANVAEVAVRADANGNVFSQPPLPAGQYTVELNFPGDGQKAPSSVKYQLAVSN